MQVAVSLLAFDFLYLSKQLEEVEDQVDWLHFDVMDGHFVPNISFGPQVLQDVSKQSALYKDVHLMIYEPHLYIDAFMKAGADLITFHYEAYESDDDILSLIKIIKALGLKAGLSIKPKTQPKDIVPFLNELDLVLVMSVEPGFGGQKFMPEALDKVAFLSTYKKAHDLNYLIEVDGGVNDQNAPSLKEKGAEVLVSGSYIMKGDIKENIARLK